MPAIPKLALGLHRMLLLAILDHRRTDPLGRPPKRFELPGDVFMDFRIGLELRDVAIDCDALLCDVVKWNGVEVHGVPSGRPKMITADNIIEYLC